MLREAALSFAILLSPADWTQCKVISPGPIIQDHPERPFSRKPDMTAEAEVYPKTMTFDGMPPKRFRGPITITVETGSVSSCGKAAPGFILEACSDGLVLYLPNPCDFPDEKFAVLMCHEAGHAEGWPKDHGA